jgi:hypothetical protein
MSNDPFRKIEKQTRRTWYADGLWEIGFGALCIILGLLYLISSTFEQGGPYAVVLVLLQMGVILFSFWAVRKFVLFLKERITYPRSGYVEYRKPTQRSNQRSRLLGLIFAAGVVGLVIITSALRVAPNRLPLIVAAVFAIALTMVGYNFDLKRMYLLAALTLAWGFSMGFFPMNSYGSIGLFNAGFGVLTAISGAITLWFYLRSTKPAGNVDYEPPSQENHFDQNQQTR